MQGARLTASVAYDMGIPVTVITDNMPAYVLYKAMAQVVVSAADVITMDGYVVNKVGTYQIAMAARTHSIPFYAIGTPSMNIKDINSVTIEERAPEEVLYAMGVRTAKKGVSGYYPAFDITPPDLITAIITPRGVFETSQLEKHFEKRADL